MPCILLLTNLLNCTGNKTTIERVRSYFSDWSTILCDARKHNSSEEFKGFVSANKVQFILGLHVIKAGKLLIECGVPFVVIFGGTDLNEWKSLEETEIILQVLREAKCLVAFSNEMKTRACRLWPEVDAKKIVVQSQGVTLERPCDLVKIVDVFPLNVREAIQNTISNMKIFLWVGGIRPVKDPLFLLGAFSDWHNENDTVIFVCVGPELDVEFTNVCKSRFEKCNGVYMVPALELKYVHSLMMKSFALVNSSRSEGMAGAVLEAMKIGLPVIARRNDGNAAIIDDNQTGLLFDTPEEFILRAKSLIASNGIRKRLIENGQQYIKRHHNMEVEKRTYRNIIEVLLNSKD